MENNTIKKQKAPRVSLSLDEIAYMLVLGRLAERGGSEDYLKLRVKLRNTIFLHCSCQEEADYWAKRLEDLWDKFYYESK